MTKQLSDSGAAKTADDLPLFDKPVLPAVTPDAVYDERNPQIWQRFLELTFRLIRREVDHYGAKAIFESIRDRTATGDNEPTFKVNNNYTRYYAEKFMRLYPHHDGFFELRG